MFHEFIGKSDGTEVTRLLELDLLQLEVCTYNPSAERMYEKVGFIREVLVGK